mgnify:CR=1 FL=1
MSARARDAGFTLLEMLVAVTVLALIIALTLPVIRLAVSAETRIAGISREWDEQGSAEAVIRHLVWRAQAAPETMEAGRFQGTASRVRMLTRPEGLDELYVATFSISGRGLRVSLSPMPASAGGTYQSVLIENAEDLQFHYFGERPDGRGMMWTQSWEEDYPPRLVVLDMARRDGQVRRIEALVGGRGPVECQFDSGNGICLGVG